MNKERNEIENLFRTNLMNYEVESPAFVKQNVDRKIFKKNRWLYVFIIMVVAVMAIIALPNFFKKDQENIAYLFDKATLMTNSKTIVQDILVSNEPSILVNKNNKEKTDVKYQKSTQNIKKKGNLKQYDLNKPEINLSDDKIQNDNLQAQKVEQQIHLKDSSDGVFIPKMNRLQSKRTDLLEELLEIEKPEKLNFRIGFNGGICVNTPKYSSNNLEDELMYSTGNHEKLGYNFQIDFDALYKNKWLIGSGLGVNQQIYDHSYNEQVLVPLLDFHDTLVYIYPPYDSTVVNPSPIDSVYYQVVDTVGFNNTVVNNSGTTNAIYMQIPLRLGYNIHFNKIDFSLVSVLNYNLLVGSNGSFYAEQQIIPITNTKSSVFKKSYFSFLLGARISYHMSRHILLNADFSYSPFSNNVYKNMGVTRSVNQTKIGLGLAYKF